MLSSPLSVLPFYSPVLALFISVFEPSYSFSLFLFLLSFDFVLFPCSSPTLPATSYVALYVASIEFFASSSIALLAASSTSFWATSTTLLAASFCAASSAFLVASSSAFFFSSNSSVALLVTSSCTFLLSSFSVSEGEGFMVSYGTYSCCPF